MKLKSYFFILSFIVMTLFLYFLSQLTKYKDGARRFEVNELPELTCQDLDREIDSGKTCFILFYQKDSPYSVEMLQKLNKLYNDKHQQDNFYSFNVDEYEECPICIPGTPYVMIIRDGKEIAQIMGVVSDSNLEMIYNRITNGKNKKFR